MTDEEIIRGLKALRSKSGKWSTLDQWSKSFVRDNMGARDLTEKQRNTALRILDAVEVDPKTSLQARQHQWDGARVCGICDDGLCVVEHDFYDDSARAEGATRAGTVYACTCPKGKLRQKWQGLISVLETQ